VTDQHAASNPPDDDPVAHHDPVTHMDAHSTLSDDDHGHGEVALGPIDWGMWAYAVIGALGAVIVLAFFVFALGGLPA